MPFPGGLLVPKNIKNIYHVNNLSREKQLIHMILIQELSLENYRNIKALELKGLRHLNILVGPSDCGKTNLLRAIESVFKLQYGYRRLLCKECENKADQIESAGLFISRDDSYLRKDSISIKIQFNEKELEKLAGNSIRQRRKALKNLECHCCEIVTLKQKDTLLLCEHFSPFTDKNIVEILNRSVLLCPESRLETYHGEKISDYAAKKNLGGATLKKLEKILNDLVDSRIINHDPFNFDLTVREGEEEFRTAVSNYGSGIRSMICLLADILSEEKALIVLIDEPELGLNPASKYKLLGYFLEMSETKQIFMATHDPTFVNPVFWRNDRVSVYLYSVPSGEFVRVNLTENKEDPDTFAGYLPHTTSLKNIHLYVEGSLDAYIFQIFFWTYLSKEYEKWWKVFNQTGIYHLGGSFWRHLLYLIPDIPQRLIVLDQNEKEDRQSILENYERMKLDHMPSFELCESIEQIEKILRDGRSCPLYCLQKSAIEEYLDPNPKEKKHAPKIAWKMAKEGKIPEEIEKIFKVFLSGCNMSPRNLNNDLNNRTERDVIRKG